jgi:arylsulfatase A-like enzyme
MLNAREIVGTHDILLVTLDALRYDVAVEALDAGLTPNIKALLPGGKWELRHSPGNFTLPAHQAFFTGFLPTPARPGRYERLFAVKFEGSVTTGDSTFVFDTPDIISGFASQGYRTVCIGGVGFFNKLNPLGNALPAFFSESYWNKSLGVTDRNSTANQVRLAAEIVNKTDNEKRLFLFLNVSALHQPNCIFADGATEDSKETQAQALSYVDKQLPKLLDTMRRRAPLLVLIFSDHGTAYGEDGFVGHRVSHECVWNVPYSEFVLPQSK